MEQFFKEILEGSSVDVFSTPVGSLIKAGTSTTLNGPEWSINMEIVDQLNAGGKDACADCIKAISSLFKQPDGDYKVVYLALIILETCMKNCGPLFAGNFTVIFMQELIALAKGSRGKKNADEASRLIQQWSRHFEKDRSKFPLFFDTYVALKAKGVTFPSESNNGSSDAYEDLPAITSNTPPTPPPHTSSSSIAAAASEPPLPSHMAFTNHQEFIQLEQDLCTVMEKVTLCKEMLHESPGIHADELLAEVIGFLEACRDRLADVVESGTHGLLTEDLLSKCLKVNDAVIRTLDAERDGCGVKGDAWREDDEEKEIELGSKESRQPSSFR